MIVLASASPRRRELLARLEPRFEVQPSRVEEVTSKKRPSFMARDLARQKAEYVALSHPDDLVVGSDTIVYFRGKALGKPRDREEAERFLSELCGKWHVVYTGVCLIKGGKIETAYALSRVKLRKMSIEEISEYVRGGSPLDKAGAYGVQDGVVEKFCGEYENIMGLPVSTLAGMRLWKER